MGFFLAAGFIYKTYAWKQVSKSDNEEAEQEAIKEAFSRSQADLDAEKEHLHGLTVKELTVLAREQNLKGYSKLKKADLIAALIKQG